MRLLLSTLAFLAVWLIALMPLQVVGLAAGGALAGTQMRGSVWEGRILAPQLAGYRLRRVAVAADPLELVSGHAAFAWRVDDPRVSGQGRAVLGWDGGWRLDGVALRLRPELDPFGGLGEGLLQWQLDLDELVMGAEGCRSVRGEIRQSAATALEWPVLAGEVTCNDGVLQSRMTGGNTQLRADLDISAGPAGLRWTVTVDTADPQVEDALRLSGFEPVGGRWRLAGSRAHAR